MKHQYHSIKRIRSQILSGKHLKYNHYSSSRYTKCLPENTHDHLSKKFKLIVYALLTTTLEKNHDNKHGYWKEIKLFRKGWVRLTMCWSYIRFGYFWLPSTWICVTVTIQPDLWFSDELMGKADILRRFGKMWG